MAGWDRSAPRDSVARTRITPPHSGQAGTWTLAREVAVSAVAVSQRSICWAKADRQSARLAARQRVGEEAEVPDAMEAVRERVQEKAADELVGCELHDLDGAVLAIVLPGERDMVVFDRDEAAVGDGDPVGVAAEIRERLGGSAEGPFGVDHPGGGAQVGR